MQSADEFTHISTSYEVEKGNKNLMVSVSASLSIAYTALYTDLQGLGLKLYGFHRTRLLTPH